MSWIEQLLGGHLNLSAAFGILATGYFLGCFATGYYLVRWRKDEDVRELGSGNIGAKNVGRVLGYPGFVLTCLGDLAKGALAVAIALYFTNDHRLALVALIAAVIGHIWPFQLGFRGGKGVATSLGALLIYNYRLAAIFVVICAIGFIFARRTVLVGLTAYALLPVAGFFLNQDSVQIAGLSILATLVLAAHHKNLADEINQALARRSAPPPEN